MTLTLLSHQWRAFWRGRSAGKNLAAQIFIGFLFLYLSACALLLGISLKYFIHKLMPGQDVTTVFCSLILYYFSVDVLMRFMFQELPVLSVQPYLTQNIRRSQLVHFLNVRSLFHFLNIIPLFLFIPFSVTVIAREHGVLTAACFVGSILFITVFNHFLSLYIKRKTIVNSWWFLIFAGAVAAFMALDYFHIVSIRSLSATLFTALLSRPWLVIIPLAMGILAFYVNKTFLRKNLYLEEISKKDKAKTSTNYTWLQQWGVVGELIGLDLKLIMRNKRPRTVLFVSVFILFYGFIFYTKENLDGHKYGMLMLGAIFVTGIFILNYGQFLFAWHSNYFDGLMTSNVDMNTFIKSKMVLFTAVGTISFLITSLYGLISWMVIPIQLAALLYNIGVNSVLATYLATFSYKGIDLNKSATFNYQGTGSSQWIFALLVTVVPLLVNAALFKWVHPVAGLIFLGSVGLISLLMRNWWIGVIEKEFTKRKYRILEGFREK